MLLYYVCLSTVYFYSSRTEQHSVTLRSVESNVKSNKSTGASINIIVCGWSHWSARSTRILEAEALGEIGWEKLG